MSGARINRYTLPKKFPLLPRRKNTNKSDYGHTLVLAGSKNMMGAANLVSRAALYSGSGLVTLGVPEGLEKFTAQLPPEIMRLSLPATAAGAFVQKFIGKRKITCVALGPGLSTHERTATLVRKLVASLKIPVVLDAGGLNAFEGKAALLGRRKCPLVLTPHAGEFERLFKKRVPKGLSGRIELAKKLARFYDGVLVLKGHRTLVADKDSVYVNTTGNPGMAKGGTGDVLTGIIASFISQGLSPFLASVWAVYFHGLAGDLAAKEKGELSVTASDMIRLLPQAFKRYLLE